jgi:hypothetical protein
MRLFDRLKNAFRPASHASTQSFYIPSVNYGDDPVENSVWRSERDFRLQDWKGDTGRVPYSEAFTFQGPLLFALRGAKVAGVGGNNFAFGQGVTNPVTGFAGRPAQLGVTSTAAEFDAVQL